MWELCCYRSLTSHGRVEVFCIMIACEVVCEMLNAFVPVLCIAAVAAARFCTLSSFWWSSRPLAAPVALGQRAPAWS